jgi:ADP-ribose pyrophosphatase
MWKKMHDPSLDEHFVSSEEVYHGRLLHVFRDKVTLVDGKETTRELIRHPGAVAVVPILPDGRLVLVKQFRYPVDSVLYELPAGKLDPGEDPQHCAVRELSEETGFEAGMLEYLTTIATTPGFADEAIHLYVAKDLRKHEQHTDEGEFINLEYLTMETVREMIIKGVIYDAKTIAALGFLAMRQ